jgi:integrase
MPTTARNIFPLTDGRFAVRYRYGRKDCKRIFDSKEEAKQFIRAECELLRAYGQLWKQFKGNQLGRLFFVVDQLAPGDPTQGVRILELLVKEHLKRPVLREKAVSVAEAAESLIVNWAKDSANAKSRNYHRNAAAIIRCFATVHGSRNVAEVTSAMVRAWVSEQSPGNQITAKARASLLFSHCIENDWRKDNPVAGFKLHKKRRPVVEVPSAKMIGRFLAMTMERAHRALRPSIVLRLFAGLRTIEAARIEWKHIDLQRQTVSIPQGIAAKNGKARTVPIADNLAAWLAQDTKRTGRSYDPIAN